VLSDLKLPGASGLEVVRAARSAQPPVAAIVMTAFGTVGAAVEAMKLGAADFLEKPVEIDELLRRVATSTGANQPRAPFTAPGCPPIVGSHPRPRAPPRRAARHPH